MQKRDRLWFYNLPKAEQTRWRRIYLEKYALHMPRERPVEMSDEEWGDFVLAQTKLISRETAETFNRERDGYTLEDLLAGA